MKFAVSIRRHTSLQKDECKDVSGILAQDSSLEVRIFQILHCLFCIYNLYHQKDDSTPRGIQSILHFNCLENVFGCTVDPERANRSRCSAMMDLLGF